jgi:manganese oxidase
LKEGAAAAPAPESAPDKAKMAAKPGEKVMTVTKGGKHHGH